MFEADNMTGNQNVNIQVDADLLNDLVSDIDENGKGNIDVAITAKPDEVKRDDQGNDLLATIKSFNDIHQFADWFVNNNIITQIQQYAIENDPVILPGNTSFPTANNLPRFAGDTLDDLADDDDFKQEFDPIELDTDVEDLFGVELNDTSSKDRDAIVGSFMNELSDYGIYEDELLDVIEELYPGFNEDELSSIIRDDGDYIKECLGIK